jgi:pimeloyl-ACP methyl ester carboxylesterase
MPIAKLSNGTLLEYFDSHTVLPLGLAETKTTLIMTHGVGSTVELMTTPLFHRGLLRKHGLHIIAYNRRGFGNSTPLTEAELTCKADRTQMCLDYTTDCALFLEYVHKTLKPAGHRIFLGWSKACEIVLGVANPTFLPATLRANALASVDELILFEPTAVIFGKAIEPTPELQVMRNLSDFAVFERWTTGHYQHPDAGAGLFASTPGRLTVDDAAAANLYRRTQVKANIQHGSTWCARNNKEMQAFTIAALHAPDARLRLLYAGESAGWFVAAANEARQIGVTVQCGSFSGNHFFFLEQPEVFLDAVCKPSAQSKL